MRLNSLLCGISQIYAQKYSALKFVYEQKILMIEKSYDDQNQRHEKLETENQSMFAHIIQLTRNIEMATESSKQRRPRLPNDSNIVPNFPPLPTDINA